LPTASLTELGLLENTELFGVSTEE
jgi:hypothetical protein